MKRIEYREGYTRYGNAVLLQGYVCDEDLDNGEDWVWVFKDRNSTIGSYIKRSDILKVFAR